jgi:2-dehydropantoate 2-reductase
MLGTRLGPVHVQNTLPHPWITLGELNGTGSERVGRLEQAFKHSGVQVSISHDIRAARWQKLLLVGPFGGVGAVTRATIGIVREVHETRILLEGTMQEVAAVAHANGIALDRHVVENALTQLDRSPAQGIGAMQAEIMAGRPSELDSQIGAIVRLGPEVGVGTPCHSFLLWQPVTTRIASTG